MSDAVIVGHVVFIKSVVSKGHGRGGVGVGGMRSEAGISGGVIDITPAFEASHWHWHNIEVVRAEKSRFEGAAQGVG